MSGIAFQKRFGDMTVDNQILQAIKDGNKPDLYKMARLFAPTMALVAITESWTIDFTNNSSVSLEFDGKYFGIFKMHHIQPSVGTSNNTYRRTLGRLYNEGAVVAQTGIIVHGDDVVAFTGDHAEHLGFATSMSLTSFGGGADHSLAVQFIGFRLGDAPPPAITYVSDFPFVYGNESDKIAHIVSPGSGIIGKPSTRWLMLSKGSDTTVMSKISFDGAFAYYLALNNSSVITDGFDLAPYWDDLTQTNMPIISLSIKQCMAYVFKLNLPEIKAYVNDVYKENSDFSADVNFYVLSQTPPDNPELNSSLGGGGVLIPDRPIMEMSVFDIGIQRCVFKFSVSKTAEPVQPITAVVKREGVVQAHVFENSAEFWIYKVEYLSSSDVDMRSFTLHLTNSDAS